jgi:hypothetical protein
MTIDLSKYLNKTITVELGDGKIRTSTAEECSVKRFPYKFDSYFYTKDGIGFFQPNIVRIISVEQEFKGIAQKAPHINLEDFSGQNVYVKLKSGKYLLRVLEQKSKNVWYLREPHSFVEYKRNGTPCITQSDDRWDIEEIYGEGAYEIKTKSTFDEPEDPKIEQAKELLSQMSKEQVAKLLKSL